MKTINYRAEYEKIKGQYDLPPYDDFNAHMEVSFLSYDIYDTDMMARFFRRMCERRLEGLIGFFQNLVQPSQQMMVLLEESQSLSEDQKNEITKMVKKAMALYRTCGLLNYTFDEQKECDKIKEIIAMLNEYQPFVDKLMSHLQQTWEKITEKTESAHYFG
mgnify:CR=1 FL=1